LIISRSYCFFALRPGFFLDCGAFASIKLSMRFILYYGSILIFRYTRTGAWTPFRPQNHGNRNLSTVVLTEKSRCRNIPDKNKTAKTIHRGHPEYHDIKNPPIIVITTSTMATSNKRYLCAPVPGSPNMPEYLDKSNIYVYICMHNIYKGESHKYKDVSISHIVDFVYVSGFHAL